MQKLLFLSLFFTCFINNYFKCTRLVVLFSFCEAIGNYLKIKGPSVHAFNPPTLRKFTNNVHI